MTAQITVSRRDNRNEDQFFQAEVGKDRNGDIWARCAEDVPEIKSATRYGPKEPYFTGNFRYKEGDPIDLTEEEESDAKKAIAELEAIFQGEIDQLKQDLHLKP